MNTRFAKSLICIGRPCLTCIVLTGSICENATAAIVVTAHEENSDVIFRGGGTVDTTALTVGHTLTAFGPGINAYTGLRFQPQGSLPVAIYIGNITPLPDFGNPALSRFRFADASSGNFFGLFEATSTTPFHQFHLAPGYASGAYVFGSMTFEDATFDTLGLLPGVYVGSWATSSGVDSFTLRIIPEPNATLLAAIAAILLYRKRRLSHVAPQLWRRPGRRR